MRYFQLCGLFPLFLFLFCFSFCMFVCLFIFICQSRADGGPFDIIPYIVRCALDIICSKLPSLNNRSAMRIPTLRRWTFIYESLNHHFNENLQLCCLHFTFIFWTFFFFVSVTSMDSSPNTQQYAESPYFNAVFRYEKHTQYVYERVWLLTS